MSKHTNKISERVTKLGPSEMNHREGPNNDRGQYLIKDDSQATDKR